MAVKPMNCPGHCVLYAGDVRSYRDLPIKIAEYGPLARYEPSGTLHGALRVRGFHQDDAHIFAREDQIEEQIGEVLELVDEMYKAFGMSYEHLLLDAARTVHGRSGHVGPGRGRPGAGTEGFGTQLQAESGRRRLLRAEAGFRGDRRASAASGSAPRCSWISRCRSASA